MLRCLSELDCKKFIAFKISCIILNAALSPYSMRFAAQFIRCVRSLRESMKAREQFRILLGSGTKSRTIIKIAVRIALNAVRSKSNPPVGTDH